MTEIGAQAFRKAMINGAININKRTFTAVVDGRTIDGFFEVVNGERVPKSWWLRE